MTEEFSKKIKKLNLFFIFFPLLCFKETDPAAQEGTITVLQEPPLIQQDQLKSLNF